MIGIHMPRIGLIGDYRHDTCQAPQVARLLRHEGFQVIEAQKNVPLSVQSHLLEAADVLYNLGRNKHGSEYLRFAALTKKPYVNHWIGSDVLELGPVNEDAGYEAITRHLACAPWIAAELRDHGIHADVIPLISFDQDMALDRPPAAHAVVSLLPTGKSRFYGIDGLVAAARGFPGIPFYITGNDGAGEPTLDNIHYRGWLSGPEMAALYAKCSILLRTPEHDGLSMMVIEAMGKGKEVIYSYAYPHCRLAACDDDILEAMRQITSSAPQANVEAHDYVNHELSRAVVGTALRSVFASL